MKADIRIGKSLVHGMYGFYWQGFDQFAGGALHEQILAIILGYAEPVEL
jgi:hypothetical protein